MDPTTQDTSSALPDWLQNAADAAGKFGSAALNSTLKRFGGDSAQPSAAVPPSQVQTPTPPPTMSASNNTMLYIGIAAVVVVLLVAWPRRG